MVSYTIGGHASSTQSTYKQGTVTYHHFCRFIGLESRKGRVVPPSHKHLLLFIVYLAHFRKLSYSCIRTYVSAVRDWALQLGFKDPTNPAGSHHRHRYQKLLRGIQRASCCRKRIRKPLKRKQLCKVLSMLEIQDSVDSRCIKAALTLAFYGFFRCSDYTLNAYNRKSFLRRKDIGIKLGSKPQLKVTLRKTKTDQFSYSKVSIVSNGKSDCPVRAMLQYLVCFEQMDTEAPLFRYQDRPLTSQRFNEIFRSLLKQSGLNPSHFPSHSLRSGAASTAANSGVPAWLIQKLGRWKSGCYKTYIPRPTRLQHNAQQAMSML